MHAHTHRQTTRHKHSISILMQYYDPEFKMREKSIGHRNLVFRETLEKWGCQGCVRLLPCFGRRGLRIT